MQSNLTGLPLKLEIAGWTKVIKEGRLSAE
jgi:hypothetical protein